jgi:hypothetical protein
VARKDAEVTGWTGWVGFASLMLYLAGFFHLIAGLAALLNDKVYVLGPENLWILDITQWGWAHIIGGAVLVWAANSLSHGHGFGRTVAVIAAIVSAIVNMAFVPIYPIWALLIITLDILVVYAVVVHGGEMKNLE